jgi:hypothetical protein
MGLIAGLLDDESHLAGGIGDDRHLPDAGIRGPFSSQVPDVLFAKRRGVQGLELGHSPVVQHRWAFLKWEVPL